MHAHAHARRKVSKSRIACEMARQSVRQPVTDLRQTTRFELQAGSQSASQAASTPLLPAGSTRPTRVTFRARVKAQQVSPHQSCMQQQQQQVMMMVMMPTYSGLQAHLKESSYSEAAVGATCSNPQPNLDPQPRPNPNPSPNPTLTLIQPQP